MIVVVVVSKNLLNEFLVVISIRCFYITLNLIFLLFINENREENTDELG